MIFGLWFFLLRQMQAGGNRAFAFGKSKAKLLTGDTPKVTFADVAGCDEAKVELQEIIEFLKDPQKFTRLGGRLPKGALLVGPAGHRQDAARQGGGRRGGTARSSRCRAPTSSRCSSASARRRVRDLFEQGKAHAPCIIFIDEIDAVGRHRGAGLGGGHDEREQTLNQLLVEMDGFESNDGVILIAATNRPDVLDPGAAAPGPVRPPDRGRLARRARAARGSSACTRARSRSVADVRPRRSSRKGTPGMAGADLANLVNEAALLAARHNKTLVDMSDFEDAKDKVMLGVERRSLVLTEEERKLTAYHEAGHAVVSLMTPGSDPIHKVTIVPRGRALGLTMSLPDKDRHDYTKEWLIGRLAMRFGGRVAEELVFGPEKVTTGAGSDIEQATDTGAPHGDAVRHERAGRHDGGGRPGARDLPRPRDRRSAARSPSARREMVDDEVKRFLDEAFEQGPRRSSPSNRDLLDRIALALLERETIDREDLDLLLRGEPLPPRPPVVSAAGPGADGAGQGRRPAARGPLPCSARRRPSPRARECHAADAPKSRGAARGAARPGLGCRHGNHDGGRRRRRSPFVCTGLEDDTLQALVVFGGSHGLDVITGPDWAIIAGSRARLGALARPWFVPEPLQELATALGLALPAEIPARWQTARGAIALDRPAHRRHPQRDARTASAMAARSGMRQRCWRARRELVQRRGRRCSTSAASRPGRARGGGAAWRRSSRARCRSSNCSRVELPATPSRSTRSRPGWRARRSMPARRWSTMSPGCGSTRRWPRVVAEGRGRAWC